VSNAPSYAAVVTPHLGESHLNLHYTRVHLDVHPFLLGMSIASLCNPLGPNPTWQWSLKTTLVLLRISPLDWTYFGLKTATFEILINDKLPPELSLLAAQCNSLGVNVSMTISIQYRQMKCICTYWVQLC